MEKTLKKGHRGETRRPGRRKKVKKGEKQDEPTRRKRTERAA